MIRWFPISVILATVACIEVTDLRDTQDSDAHLKGQVDTGWTPKDRGPELPPAIACSTDQDCVAWLGTQNCLTPACEDGGCVAEPKDEGTPCSDGDYRTLGDSCQIGLCTPGPSVCVCQSDAQCNDFDDGNPCNGRMVCDGCTCRPLATGKGSPCDDLNPATLDDVCLDQTTCVGTIPCQCTDNDDCPKPVCAHSICTDCLCQTHAAIAGIIYATESFDTGLPVNWSATSTNASVTWRGDKNGGLRATGDNGSYDYGAARAVLKSPPVVLPPGAAVLRLSAGLHSAEQGCDDRLEIVVNGTLVDTLCGPTETATRTYAIEGDQIAQMTATLVTNDKNNAGAGAFLDNVRWVRAQPSDCAPPTQEKAVPAITSGHQIAPQIALIANQGGLVAWTDQNALKARLITASDEPTGDDMLLDANGSNARASAQWLAWERQTDANRQIVVGKLADLVQVVPDSDDCHSPDVAVPGPIVVYLAETANGRFLRRFDIGSNNDPTTVAGPDDQLKPAAITQSSDGLWVLITDANGLSLHSQGGTTQLSELAPETSPDLAAGHGSVAAVWPVPTGIQVRSGDNETWVGSLMPQSPSVVSTAAGWLLAWTVSGENDTGVSAAFLSKTLDTTQPIKIAGYTFSNQDSIHLAPRNTGALAVWRTDWFDGDPSGIVLRKITSPEL